MFRSLLSFLFRFWMKIGLSGCTISEKNTIPAVSVQLFSCLPTLPSSYILPDASRQSGQKTRVAKRSVSPTYNHTMVYDGFHTSDLREACAELTVWQRDGLKTHVLGGIRLSCGTGEGFCWGDFNEFISRTVHSAVH